MIITGIQIIETILYAYLVICVGYLALFCIRGSICQRKEDSLYRPVCPFFTSYSKLQGR